MQQAGTGSRHPSSTGVRCRQPAPTSSTQAWGERGWDGASGSSQAWGRIQTGPPRCKQGDLGQKKTPLSCSHFHPWETPGNSTGDPPPAAAGSQGDPARVWGPLRTVALHCSRRARDGGRRRQQRRRKKRSGRDTLPLCSELPGLPQPGRDTRWCLLPSPGSSEEGCSSTAIRSSLPPGSRQCSACLHGCCWGKLHAGKLSRDGHSWAAHYCTSPGSLRFKHGAVQDPRCSRP